MITLPRSLLRMLPSAMLLALALASSSALAAPPAPERPATASAEAPVDGATLMLFNRPIAQLRASLPGLTPLERVHRAQGQLQRALDKGGPQVVTLLPLEPGQGEAVLVDGVRMFSLLPLDTDAGTDAKQVVAALQVALEEAREARTPTRLLRAIGVGALATLVFGVCFGLLLRLRRWLEARVATRLSELSETHGKRLALGGNEQMWRDRAYGLARLFTRVLISLLLLAISAEWLGFLMRQFPYTRRWGEELHASAIALAELIFGSIAASLPGLVVALVIFAIARGVLDLTKPLFAQVERGELSLKWVDQDTVRSTRGLVHMGVWVFALAMAYPYLPGAQTDAFKGMSVLLGVMVSLGASNILGQAVSGLIITYSHTMRVGEYVRVGDVEGTVADVGAFATRIRTGHGLDLTLPNSLVVGSVTKNFSRAVSGPGYIVEATVTIGYDTPWRQVQEMMIAAAQRTEAVMEAPAPHVFQTALDDFYVAYCLVAHATAVPGRPRAEVMNQLHANLQDVFNENNVQIMSPHYLADPANPKVVPPAQWSPPVVGKA